MSEDKDENLYMEIPLNDDGEGEINNSLINEDKNNKEKNEESEKNEEKENLEEKENNEFEGEKLEGKENNEIEKVIEEEKEKNELEKEEENNNEEKEENNNEEKEEKLNEDKNETIKEENNESEENNFNNNEDILNVTIKEKENNNENINNTINETKEESTFIKEKKKIETEEERIKRINELEKKIKEEEEEEKREKIEKEKENKIKEEKEQFKKNLEIYDKLSKNLKFTCSQIEEALDSIYKKNKKKPKKQNSKNKKDNGYEEVKLYKDKVNEIRKNLDIILNLNNINELESSEFYKKQILEKLEKENCSLNEEKNNQLNINEKKNKINEQRYKVIDLNSKISNIKEQIKIKKGYLEITQTKIKRQMKSIDKIENKCQIINDNINYQKKKEKEKDNFEELYDEEKYLNDDDLIDYNTLKKDYKSKKKKFKTSEEIYINIIKNQKEEKDKLESEINLLSTEILKFDKNIKFKNKELEKIKNKKILEIKSSLSGKNLYEINDSNLKNIKTEVTVNKYIPFNSNNKSGDSPFYIKPQLFKKKNIIRNNKSVNHFTTFREIESLKNSINESLKKDSLNDKYINSFLKSNKKINGSNERYLNKLQNY